MSSIACRHCGRPVRFERIEDAPFFPFCGKRCRLADLGEWFDEDHRISESLADRLDALEEGPGEKADG